MKFYDDKGKDFLQIGDRTKKIDRFKTVELEENERIVGVRFKQSDK